MQRAYADEKVISSQGLDFFRIGVIAAGGRMVPSGSLSFAKNIVVGWMSKSLKTQKVWDHSG
jgi:hypothetical protein